MQQYVGQPFQAFALDLWNGSEAQCELFAELAGITYPILMQAGAAHLGDQYDCIQTSFFVVDGEGVIRYRNAYHPDNWPNWHPDEVGIVVDEAISRLTPVPVADLPAQQAWLGKPFPNPANPRVTVALNLPQAKAVTVDAVDLRGLRVRRLAATSLPAGSHRFTWDGLDEFGRAAPSGTYLIWMEADEHKEGRFLSLVR